MNSFKKQKLVVQSDFLTEGFFGQLTLFTFELLPALEQAGLFPEWEIRSKNYGAPPDYVAVPGCWDLAYQPNPATTQHPPTVVSFETLHAEHARVLTGNDWHWNQALWQKYFKIHKSVFTLADAAPALGRCTLGLHYRGTDKNTDLGQTNPITQDDFLIVAGDFLDAHPEIDCILVSSDESSFVKKTRAGFEGRCRVIARDENPAPFWRGDENAAVNRAKAESALADCVLLSRCRYLLKCQSALSGFAKVLNPELQAYRITANKLFKDIPYFPDAYLPVYQAQSGAAQKILQRTMAGDWLENKLAVFWFKTLGRKSLPRFRGRALRLWMKSLRMSRRVHGWFATTGPAGGNPPSQLQKNMGTHSPEKISH